MTQQRIELDYKPRAWQNSAHRKRRRFTLLVLHRRAGKTKLAMMELIDKAVACKLPLGMFAYIAPQLKQAKTNVWDEFKRTIAPLIEAEAVEVREGDHSIKILSNNARIRLFGANDPDSMRGIRLDGVVLDEVAQMPVEMWEEIIRPALADRMGWAIFIGTVKGIDLFSTLYFKAKELIAAGNTDWFVGLWTVYDTDALPASEVAEIKSSSSPRAFAREFLCDFNAQADDQLISLYDASNAAQRVFSIHDQTILRSPVILGVDPARYGDDSSVICRRQGLFTYPLLVFDGMNNMDLADRVAVEIREHRPTTVFIDSGGGAGVIDRLRQMKFTVSEVPFGGRALTAGFVNRRVEMWWKMKKWIEAGGAIPNEPLLIRELATPTYWHNGQDLKCLESKEDLKKRLDGKSCDRADALALTFAAPVATEFDFYEEGFLPSDRESRRYHPFEGRREVPFTDLRNRRR